MQKTITSTKYLKLIDWLIKARQEQGLSMRDLAQRLDKPHSFVHKVETLERRLDVYEYVVYCEALEIEPSEGLLLLK